MNCVFVSQCSRCLSLKQIWPTGHSVILKRTFGDSKESRELLLVFFKQMSLSQSLYSISQSGSMFINSTQRWICLCSVCLSLFCMAQNEEVLKKCAQEYLARVKQEEQRYQTLKVHAEEKLDKYVVVVVVVAERKCGVRQTKYFPFECS